MRWKMRPKKNKLKMVQTSGREEDSQQKQPTKSKNRLFGSFATEQHDSLAWLFFICKIFSEQNSL